MSTSFHWKDIKDFIVRVPLQIWIYILISLGFAIFFGVVMENGNSRYNLRLRETDARIDSRMNMMRREYRYQDSVFRHEQDSLQRLDSAQGRHE